MILIRLKKTLSILNLINVNNFLFLIPARGGSKRLPQKNIMTLGNKPLIAYSIDTAREFASDVNICVSTDDKKIINIVEQYGLDVPFIRPDYLATDDAGTYEVILHAIDYYKTKGVNYDGVILLQPTSPFRSKLHLLEAIDLFDQTIDMVVSVKKAKNTPYYNTFIVNNTNYLESYIKNENVVIQETSDFFHYNGSIYVINVKSLLEKRINEFTKIKKYEMNEAYSVDIDTPFDFMFSEFLLEKKIVSF